MKYPICILCLCLLTVSCRDQARQRAVNIPASQQTALRAAGVLARVLCPHEGTGRIDREIRRLQGQVRTNTEASPELERLGWLFVAKARENFDPGFYKLAEDCGLVLEMRKPHCAEGLLLRGHAVQNLHRFQEAEALARVLVSQRGLAIDYGLLSDALMEQGRLGEAVDACQAMADLRPDLHSYSRAAHLRWLKGDLEGAIELMDMAVSAASPRDRETAAWVNTRLASYLFQTEALEEAARRCASALEFQRDYPPALLLRGRLILAQGAEPEAAVELFQCAERLNPLPEYQWALADALRLAGRESDARIVEEKLARHGAATDPRTFALYLATRGGSAELALRLAQKELATRADVFTRDAVAWSLAASGKFEQAQEQMQLALAEGTQDARLFLHAAAISARCNSLAAASQWFEKANKLACQLLPSEQKQFQALREQLHARIIPQPQATPDQFSAANR
jgi:tetratricopeptide (TPR) repeat protein